MANTKSAKKANRVSERKAVVNLRVRRSMKESIKETKALIEKGDVEEAKISFIQASSEIDKAAKKKVIKQNTASRYKSRLTKMISKAEAK